MPKNDMPLPNQIRHNYTADIAWHRHHEWQLTRVALLAVMALLVGCTALVLSVGIYEGWW
jgi:hypothetical protein